MKGRVGRQAGRQRAMTVIRFLRALRAFVVNYSAGGTITMGGNGKVIIMDND
jgi:hypothetical protein